MALIGSINAPNNFGFKNRLINGAIGIWQRGTSFTSGGSATYTADRFFGNASSGTISRSTDVPAGFIYSFSNAASSTAFPGIAQRIESVNIADCASQAITVSFWVKQTSGTASALNINLGYPTAVDNYSSSTTIVETNVVATMPSSWTQYSYTYTLPANVTNGMSITLFIPSASVTATFLITGIQVEKGSTATSFDYRPYGTELALCQRYLPAMSFAGGSNPYIGAGMAHGTTAAYYTISFPVTPRVPPTGLTVSSVSHFSGFLAGSSTSVCTGFTFAGASSHSAFVNLTGMTGLVGGNSTLIYLNNASSLLYFSGCEL
jgi:hypothetical protein